MTGRNRKYILWTVVSVLGAALAIGGFAFCSEQSQAQIEASLKRGLYAKAVRLYNEEAAAGTEEAYTEGMLQGIYDIDAKWREGELEYKEALHQIKEFKQAENGEIQELAQQKMKYIQCEGEGAEFFSLIEQAFADGKYLDAMADVLKFDKQCSKYIAAQDIYEEAKAILLETVAQPESLEDYRTFISQLECYIEAVEETDFIYRKSELERELAVIEGVNRIVKEAMELYEDGQFVEAFAVLEQGMIEYPESEELTAYEAEYHAKYVAMRTAEVEKLCEAENFKEAEAVAELAIAERDCEEIRALYEYVQKEKGLWNRIKDSVLEWFGGLW